MDEEKFYRNKDKVKARLDALEARVDVLETWYFKKRDKKLASRKEREEAEQKEASLRERYKKEEASYRGYVDNLPKIEVPKPFKLPSDADAAWDAYVEIVNEKGSTPQLSQQLLSILCGATSEDPMRYYVLGWIDINGDRSRNTPSSSNYDTTKNLIMRILVSEGRLGEAKQFYEEHTGKYDLAALRELAVAHEKKNMAEWLLSIDETAH